MNLLYKEDWEEAQERYRAWWAHEALDRCACAINWTPRDKPLAGPPWPPPPATPEQRWMDLDWIAATNDANHRYFFYGGEAFPIWHPGYPGYVSLWTFLGSPVHLDQATGWHDPILTGELADYKKLKINRDSAAWRFGLALLKRAAAECRGKSIPSIGAFGGCGDTLAGLRGTNQLLLDVMDQPDVVRAAEKYLMRIWCEVYEEFYSIIKDSAQGSTCWFELWAPGKFYASQNDFSYMISPQMFRDLFLPTIEQQLAYLDYSVYHVDGVGAFAHVPALCELPRLQAIQILPGAGKPSPLHYLDTLKYVQSHGKNLHIGLPSEEVETALAELSARGLFINTHCRSELEARELLQNLKKWSRDRG